MLCDSSHRILVLKDEDLVELRVCDELRKQFVTFGFGLVSLAPAEYWECELRVQCRPSAPQAFPQLRSKFAVFLAVYYPMCCRVGSMAVIAVGVLCSGGFEPEECSPVEAVAYSDPQEEHFLFPW